MQKYKIKEALANLFFKKTPHFAMLIRNDGRFTGKMREREQRDSSL